jgi:TPP-dependent pyruvate/acetoin dehydrogenase alpha subunit
MANPQRQTADDTRRTSHFEKLADEFAARETGMALAPGNLARCYTSLLRIRRVEEEIIRLYPTDKIKSPVYLSIGQEAVSVAVCDQLTRDDALFATYLGHAAYLAKGGDLKRMWAELYGKKDGCGRGNAGSMHLVDPSVHMMGTSAIVASGVSDAVGYALAQKMRGEQAITACFFGEGAADQGVMYESVNFAALRRLPILFVCENNEYAIHSHVRTRMAGYGLSDRFRAYGIQCEKEDSGDFLNMYDVSAHAVADLRKGLGPRFIEIRTTRWRDHLGPDQDHRYKYSSDKELDETIAGDQVKRLGEMLDEKARTAIAEDVEREIAAAIAFAESSSFPEDKKVHDHVFAE